MVVLSRRSRSALVLLGVVLAGCSSQEADPPAPTPRSSTFPATTWERIDPPDAGFDPAVLDELARRAEEAQSDCLVVVRDGRLVGEWHWRGTTPSTAREVFSVTKSIASTLVGLAQSDGLLDIDDPAAAFVSEWVGTASEEVTVRNLLSNDSGRERIERTDLWDLAAQADRTAYAIGLGQEAPPGTRWTYNNAGVQVLSRVLERATGIEAAEYADRRLFGPLGMDDTALGLDRSGGTTLAFGATTTCLDLARFGLLFLEEGRWGDEQVLPASWVAEATSPSTELTAAYGLLWWLNRSGRIVPSELARSSGLTEQTRSGQLVPDAPEDLYWALGLGDQVLQVHPGSATIVVRIGPPESSEAPNRFTESDAAEVVTRALSS